LPDDGGTVPAYSTIAQRTQHQNTVIHSTSDVLTLLAPRCGRQLSWIDYCLSSWRKFLRHRRSAIGLCQRAGGLPPA